MYARDYSRRARDRRCPCHPARIYTPIVLRQCHVHRINIMIRIVTIASCTLLASRRLRLRCTGGPRWCPGSHPVSRTYTITPGRGCIIDPRRWRARRRGLRPRRRRRPRRERSERRTSPPRRPYSTEYNGGISIHFGAAGPKISGGRGRRGPPVTPSVRCLKCTLFNNYSDKSK